MTSEVPASPEVPRVAVCSTSWTQTPTPESTAALRSVAGALSRIAAVDVYVDGDGTPFADGAFDVTPLGGARTPRSPYRAVLVEAGDGGVGRLARSVASASPEAPVLSVGIARTPVDGILDVRLQASGGEASGGQASGGQASGGEASAREASAREGGGEASGARRPGALHVGLYARVDPGARERRHHGLDRVPEYLLVLGDRVGVPTTPWPSERLRWLLARFAREHVVVVEGGVARAWRSRSCVAEFGVHTRMDLWILMARAWGLVDLLPGEVYARECVESLRYGVPIVVPEGSVAARLARAGGGVRFTSTAELLGAVATIADPLTRATLGAAGRRVADRWYGDPDGLVARLAGVLDLPGSARG
ncbi:MAG: hypothetical protein M0Z46_23090 [Actinomycetota bacterium]|nr:hypothetical protein [Actinomycetota bacterium]